MKRILAAVDHSDASLRAAELATEIARKFDAELALLMVSPRVASTDAPLEDYLRAEHISDPASVVIADAAREELRALADRLTEKSKQAVTCEVAVGDAAEAIVSFAARLAVDLIAIGHVGHGRVGDLVLGSVAKRVIDTAPCPVLVVRPTHNEYARRAEI